MKIFTPKSTDYPKMVNPAVGPSRRVRRNSDAAYRRLQRRNIRAIYRQLRKQRRAGRGLSNE